MVPRELNSSKVWIPNQDFYMLRFLCSSFNRASATEAYWRDRKSAKVGLQEGPVRPIFADFRSLRYASVADSLSLGWSGRRLQAYAIVLPGRKSGFRTGGPISALSLWQSGQNPARKAIYGPEALFRNIK